MKTFGILLCFVISLNFAYKLSHEDSLAMKDFETDEDTSRIELGENKQSESDETENDSNEDKQRLIQSLYQDLKNKNPASPEKKASNFPEEIVNKFNDDMKRERRMAYMLIVLDGNKELKIVKEQPKGDSFNYDAFVQDVMSYKEGCLAILDCEDRFVLVAWVPDSANTMSKMFLRSRMSDLQNALAA